MDDLTAFFKARLAEDEAHAEAMHHEVNAESDYFSCPATRTEPLGDLEWGEENCWCGLAERKGRALREVAAKRAIVAYFELCMREESNGTAAAVLEEVVTQLATVWSDHPDYRPEWAL